MEEKTAAKNESKWLYILNQTVPLICGYYRSVFSSMCLFLHLWKKWQVSVKKLQKVHAKNKRCPWAFWEIQNFQQFSFVKQEKGFHHWNRKILTREKFEERFREQLQVGKKKL